MQIKFTNINTIWVWVLPVIFLTLLAIPYIQAESLTRLYNHKIDGQEICESKYSDGYKYFKIVLFEGHRGRARILCINEPLEESLELRLSRKGDRWLVTFSQNINKPRSLYWPLYV